MTEIPAPPLPGPKGYEPVLSAEDQAALAELPPEEPTEDIAPPPPPPPAAPAGAPEQPPAEAAQAAPAEPALPDPVQAELEEIRLRMEEADIQAKLLSQQLEHERLLREQAASKAGYYKRVATDLAVSQREPAPPVIPDADYPDETPRPAAVSPEAMRFQQELQALREDAVERAQMEAVSQFFAAHPEANEIQQELTPYVQQARARYAEWLDSGDPKLIRKAAMMTLDSAYLNAQKARVAAKRTERLTARASQLQRLAEDKRAAAIPGSGSAAPSPQGGPRPPEEWNDDEIERGLQAWASGQGRKR